MAARRRCVVFRRSALHGLRRAGDARSGSSITRAPDTPCCRGGQFEITSLRTDVANPAIDARGLQAIGDALDELPSVEPALAEIVDLKFFCGFSFAEIAAMRRISERTVQRSWEKARLYLHQQMRPQPSA